MASGWPRLFGTPDFGSQERNDYLKAITMFLRNPFRPDGGNRYQWGVPTDALTGTIGGDLLDFANVFGIADFHNGGTLTIGDSSTGAASIDNGLLVICDENHVALVLMYGRTTTPGTHVASQSGATFSTTQDNPGTTNLYHDGSIFTVQNKTGASVAYSFLVVTLRRA